MTYTLMASYIKLSEYENVCEDRESGQETHASKDVDYDVPHPHILLVHLVSRPRRNTTAANIDKDTGSYFCVRNLEAVGSLPCTPW